MVEPRLPEPMTPERAEQLANRWRLVAYALVLGSAVALCGGAPLPMLAAPILVAMWCIEFRAEHKGWLAGYRAARREELERQGSGDLR